MLELPCAFMVQNTNTNMKTKNEIGLIINLNKENLKNKMTRLEEKILCLYKEHYLIISK